MAGTERSAYALPPQAAAAAPETRPAGASGCFPQLHRTITAPSGRHTWYASPRARSRRQAAAPRALPAAVRAPCACMQRRQRGCGGPPAGGRRRAAVARAIAARQRHHQAARQQQLACPSRWVEPYLSPRCLHHAITELLTPLLAPCRPQQLHQLLPYRHRTAQAGIRVPGPA